MGQVIDEVAQYLAANGIGTVGVDIFENMLPPGIDSGLAVVETGGQPPSEYLPTYHPSFQIFLRATEYDLGRTKLDAIRALLHNKYNLTLVTNGNFYFWIKLTADGGSIGQDANGRDCFSLNFEVYRRS